MDLPKKGRIKKSMHSNHSMHTSSNISEVYHSLINSDGLKSFTLAQHINVLHISSDSDNEQNCSGKQLLKSPIATSSPLSKHNEKRYHYNNKSDYFIKSSDVTENREKKQGFSILNISQPLSQENVNNLTNILNTEQLPITPNFTKNMPSIKNTNNPIKLNSLSNNGISNSNIEEQLHLLNVENNSTNHIQFDEEHKNQINSSELVQMELNLKMFSENTIPYLDSLKHDLLQFTKNCILYKPDDNKIIRSKNITIKKINSIMKLNMNTRSVIELNKIDYNMTTPFVQVDLNALNLLNNKLKYVDKIVETIKLSFNDKILKDQNDDKECTKWLDAQRPDFEDCGHPSDYVRSLEPTISRHNNETSLTNTKTNSFEDMRELNKTFTLPSPHHNSIVFHESFPELSVKNYNDKTLKDQNDDKERIKQLDAQGHDFGDCGHTSDDVNDLRSLEPTINWHNNEISKTNTKTSSFEDLRGLNKTFTLSSPHHTSIVFHESFLELSVKNYSLNYSDKVSNKEVSETDISDVNSPCTELPNIDIFIPDNNTHCSNSEMDNDSDNQVEKNPNRYWLRKHPNATEHYFAPLNSIKESRKRKSSHNKKTCNNIFITKGSGKKRKIYQYKLREILPNNSSELIKILCPENNNNNNQNTTVFNVPNLNSKTNYKPCRCGIFPSQVPFYWNNSLHKSIHQNLHKLQFNIQTTVDVVSKINDNGLIYNIIKITKNCNNDKNLELTLKNVQDFINLELGFPKRNINNLNHSIFLAVIPNLKIIGYLEIDLLAKACIYQENQLSDKLTDVKFGVSKLWVLVNYRNNGVATKLLKQFRYEENLEINDIAFSYHGNRGISFIKKYFENNSVLVY